MRVYFIFYSSYILEGGATFQLCAPSSNCHFLGRPSRTADTSVLGYSLWLTNIEFYTSFIINNSWFDRNKLTFFSNILFSKKNLFYRWIAFYGKIASQYFLLKLTYCKWRILPKSNWIKIRNPGNPIRITMLLITIR